MARILVISDTQAPAQHPNTIEFLKHVSKEFKINRVVHIGDELDLHNLSKYTHDPDLPGPKDELEQGLAFMRKLYDLFPDVQVCISNHGARPYLRAKEAGLPSNFIRSYKEWMRAPKGWSWHHQIIIDEIAFIHGEKLSGDGARLKACTLMQKSCVFGHLHSHAGISYFSTKERLMFGFNVGCLIDLHSPYFEYNRHQFMRPIIGCGVVIDGLPQFIPMTLDKHGLWIHRKDKKSRPKEWPTQGVDDVEIFEHPSCPKCGSSKVIKRGIRTNRGNWHNPIKKDRKLREDEIVSYGVKITCHKCGKWSTISAKK